MFERHVAEDFHVVGPVDERTLRLLTDAQDFGERVVTIEDAHMIEALGFDVAQVLAAVPMPYRPSSARIAELVAIAHARSDRRRAQAFLGYLA